MLIVDPAFRIRYYPRGGTTRFVIVLISHEARLSSRAMDQRAERTNDDRVVKPAIIRIKA